MNKLFVILLALPFVGCAHIDTFIKACKDCVVQDGPQAIKDAEQNAGRAVADVFDCEVNASDPKNDVLPCVEQGLAVIVASLGPDGERFKDCVVADLASQGHVGARAYLKKHAVKH